MATKKLSDPQKKALTAMLNYEQSYFDLSRAGANSATLTMLTLRGLAIETGSSLTSRKWAITDKGRRALKDGSFKL